MLVHLNNARTNAKPVVVKLGAKNYKALVRNDVYYNTWLYQWMMSTSVDINELC